MSTTTEIRDSVYAELLAKSLPRPIHSETERARFEETLLALDDRDNVAERVPERTYGGTWIEAQGHLACFGQQRCRD
jgi:hypothetical protein